MRLRRRSLCGRLFFEREAIPDDGRVRSGVSRWKRDRHLDCIPKGEGEVLLLFSRTEV